MEGPACHPTHVSAPLGLQDAAVRRVSPDLCSLSLSFTHTHTHTHICKAAQRGSGTKKEKKADSVFFFSCSLFPSITLPPSILPFFLSLLHHVLSPFPSLLGLFLIFQLPLLTSSPPAFICCSPSFSSPALYFMASFPLGFSLCSPSFLLFLEPFALFSFDTLFLLSAPCFPPISLPVLACYFTFCLCTLISHQ